VPAPLSGVSEQSTLPSMRVRATDERFSVATAAPVALNYLDATFAPNLTAQSAHPFSATLGYAVAESATAGATAPGVSPDNDTGFASADSATLQVRSVAIMASGLHVRFNQPFRVEALGAGNHASRLVEVLRDGVAVPGRLMVDPDGAGFIFVADGTFLADGRYTVHLLSGRDAFAKPNGSALDGDYDARPGGDYRGRFDVTGTRRLSDSGSSRTVPDDDPAAGLGVLLALTGAPGITDTRMARRALAAGRRPRDESAQGAAIRLAPIGAAAVADREFRASSAWLSRWLAGPTAGRKEWRIRL